jgi:hypothetical protein
MRAGVRLFVKEFEGKRANNSANKVGVGRQRYFLPW